MPFRLKRREMLIMLIFFVLMILSILYLQNEIANKFITYGVFGLFIVIFLLELIPQFITPHIFIPISIGAGIPYYKVIIFAIFGSTIGAIFGFYLGKKYGLSVFVRILKQSNIDKFLNLVHKFGKVAVFICAISPFPYLPVVFGSLGLTWRDFWIYGLIPRAISFCFIAFAFYLGIYHPMFI